MLNKLPRPTIFAHRGASAYAPENTLPAFELAVRQGVDVIELDVKLTGDGE
ncbi:MAG: glycerophosphodiester phosphodiesterase, partial [Anaerolineales bacterium]|nr:glycerophosphodiester phosphodiesterase [Anaerolineales bacterium]